MSNSEHISEEIWERCEKYLNDTMDTAEKLEFESRLESDPELKKQFDEVESSILGIETAVLTSRLDAFHEEINPVKPLNPSGGKRFSPWTWSVAAVLVVALGLFGILNSGNQTDKLFADHFVPDPGLPTTMSSNTNYEFLEGMVDYKTGNYVAALEKWESLDESSIGADTLTYFKGVAHLANGDAESSIKYLQELWNSESNSFTSETAHYLGMAYLKTGDLEDAINYLTFSKDGAAEKVLSEIKD